MAAAPEPGEPAKGKPFKLLGILDVENIPCARDSILYGSLGSVVAGLGHFLLTSEYLFFSMYDEHFLNGLIRNVELQWLCFLTGRIRRSCDVGVGGFILVTLGCWFHCRYNYAKLRIQERTARDGIKNKILYESTHLDPERKQSPSKNSS
ncbi:cytochrome c oxidase assembly protein COX20, mitochondrial isoform X1 [Neomonachus schauinslandi]|uniref:Cytochrome c oxidase assembly protein COX20, mitochondrial n=1 Tax=Neomonachus schauinslandi TaxID=29088 RepID=A0A8M1MM49_NEOSC|nr:cytochrome c oxidase assembly protein COX20, mitochondrial isoform X1 [Neomonachus schauinslandi]